MMENTTKIKKLSTSLNDGLNALDGNVSDFRAHRETYETIYCQDDNPEHIKIIIEISIYLHKSFRKKYPGKPVLSVRTFPNIESEIKKLLAIHGMFAFIRFSIKKPLYEDDIGCLKNDNFDKDIIDTVSKMCGRDIPVITCVEINKNFGYDFIKGIFPDSTTFDNDTFIINKGKEITELKNHLDSANELLANPNT